MKRVIIYDDYCSNISVCKKQDSLERNTGQTTGKVEDSLTEGVESNSIGENLLVPSDQGTYGRAKRQETELTHVRWRSQVFGSRRNKHEHLNMQSCRCFSYNVISYEIE